MNGPCLPQEHEPPVRETRPALAIHAKRLRRNARPTRDTWLPPIEGDVSGAWHAAALTVLAIAALVLIAMLLGALASL